MKYLSTLEASKKWNISQRRVRILCQNGQIPNCVLIGKSWQIPINAEKPLDMRTNSAKVTNEHLDYLHLMLNAEYTKNKTNANNDEITICKIQQMMLEGKLDEAFVLSNELQKTCENDGYLLVIVALQFTLSFYLGKKASQTELFLKYKHLLKDERMHYLNLYLNLFINKKSPDLKDDNIPNDKLPQLLYRTKRNFLLDMISKNISLDSNFLELDMKMIEDSENLEIVAYHHTLLASYYNFFNNIELHDLHVKKALDIILPRHWYLLIAEHVNINWHLENYLDAPTINKIHNLENLICNNHIKRGAASRVVKESKLDPSLIVKIMYQIATKRTNEEISYNLNISLYLVKKYVNEIYRLVGTDDRKLVTKVLLKELNSI